MTNEEFVAEYREKNRPVILTGLIDRWLARLKQPRVVASQNRNHRRAQE
jgi:hypothetical protein